MTDLQRTAEAVIERWDSPLWRIGASTAELIGQMRQALAAERVAQTWVDRATELDQIFGTTDPDGVVVSTPQHPIDFTVLHEFADAHRISYNQLCTAVNIAVGNQPKVQNAKHDF